MRVSRLVMSPWLFLIVPAALALLLLVAGQAGLLKSSPPADLGVRDGRLKPPSDTENSVTSQASLYPDHPQRDSAEIAPISPDDQDADGSRTLARIEKVIDEMAGAVVVETSPGYLRAEFTSKMLKFIDDVEFWLDPPGNVVHVRAAARLGRSDFGANRRHVEAVRTALAQDQ